MGRTLDERLDVLEGVLGLDSNSHCLGDPTRCGDSCQPETCPFQDNVLVRILAELGEHRKRVLLTRAVVRELEDAGVITDEVWERAELRVRYALTQSHLTRAEKTLEGMKDNGAGPVLLEGASRRVEQIRRDLVEIETRLRG